MLTGLSIRDVVLIEALDLEFAGGLGVLTGETGAGKSILVDALQLVYNRLERKPEKQAFEIAREQNLGILAERWVFFADARHPQNLYQQAQRRGA